jgi:hypothetical protein
VSSHDTLAYIVVQTTSLLRLVTSDRPPSTLQEQAGGTLSLCFD